MLSFFKNNILLLFDIHAPESTVRISKPRSPWLTDTVKLMIKNKKRALAKYRRFKSPRDWESYKYLRKFTTLAIRREKKGIFKFCPKLEGH